MRDTPQTTTELLGTPSSIERSSLVRATVSPMIQGRAEATNQSRVARLDRHAAHAGRRLSMSEREDRVGSPLRRRQSPRSGPLGARRTSNGLLLT
jgi:hypothetical protein